jgi:hypothetical protein
VVNVTVTSAGTSGPRGSGWLSDIGIPSPTIGFDGDFYIDTSNTGYYYGPKTLGVWGSAHPFGVTGVSPQTVIGSRGGNAALTSLLTALSTLGLIVDNTTP